MKRYYTALLLLLSAVLGGCIKQDYNACPVPNNCTLIFQMKDASGNDLFNSKINSVDAAVFDVSNRLVAYKRLKKADLDEFCGVRFSVTPGEYRVVCWGNVFANSQLPVLTYNTTTFDDCYLETISNVSGCPLYYAPKKAPSTRALALTRAGEDFTDHTVIVTGNKITEKEVFFCRAHRTVNIFVQNYSNSPSYDAMEPTVELTNIPHKYDFYLRTASTRKNYTNQTGPVTTPQGPMSIASFNAPICDFHNTMFVNLKRSSDGLLLKAIDLKNYIDTNTIADLNEIDILISFGTNASITVTLPGWKGTNVNPIP